MNVQSLAFLAFLTVTVCACRLLGRKAQVRALLAASLVFYLWNGAAEVWWSCGLLAASSAVSLLAGNSLRRQRRRLLSCRGAGNFQVHRFSHRRRSADAVCAAGHQLFHLSADLVSA